MQAAFPSILLLTILLAIGLIFFLRAASKDRTTIVEVYSPLPELEVLNGLNKWLLDRGWEKNGGDANRQLLSFKGYVEASNSLALFLSVLGGFGGGSLGLVLKQLYPSLGWWPLVLSAVAAPAAGLIYKERASRMELLEFRLLNETLKGGTHLKIKAHRDEIIAIELELSKSLKLASDGSLLSSPI